ncbi:proline--tRNA ligase [Thermodesulfovibrionales bacterium]|nr:proline--tRNA ligase [Thermodesulfovibrionales bacterium]
MLCPYFMEDAFMRFSKMLIPTMRESPSDAETVSHKLMMRAGYVRQFAAGLYVFLPLGWHVLNKINKILEEEMNSIGAQEISMPILHPADIWQKTGRWHEIKEEMFRLKDRTERDMCLGMTHEEVIAWLASKEIRSYRDLPQIWYQIQTKLRDEARPKSGVLRTREFIMKDSYSLDADEEALDKSYKLHADAYHRILRRCGLKFYQVMSDPGMMGGATAHEFMAPSPAGEDRIELCDECGYTANVEIASSVSPPTKEIEGEYEEVYTPGKKTIKEVSDFLNAELPHFIKSLLFIANEEPVLVLIRGDQRLHEKKLEKIIGLCRAASEEEVLSILGVEAGFIGPMKHRLRILSDNSLAHGTYIAGANRVDYHIKGIRPDIHFKAEWHDLHTAKEGDTCPECNSLIKIEKVIEVGNIFKLGTKYSVLLNAVFLDKSGSERPIVMGSYGIGPARIAAAAIEQNHDKDGIIWPKSIAPFDVEIIPLNVNDTATMEVAELLYRSLKDNNIGVLMDDRDERPGVKFKDADLIGIPLHIILGTHALKDDQIEIKKRRTKEIKKVPIKYAIKEIISAVYETE